MHVLEMTSGSKVYKKMEKVVAQQVHKEVRKRIIDAAYLIRDTVADNAPNETYRKLLLGTPLERYYNYNSGFDVRMDAGMQARFVLKLSTDRFSQGTYLGYNPVWGLLASNYGREPKYIGEHKVPIPVNSASSKSKRMWNHPKFGTGHRSMYKGKRVAFVSTIPGITGTHWIEDGVTRVTKKVDNLIAGRSSYDKRKTTEAFWG